MTQKDCLFSLMHNISTVSLGFAATVAINEDLRSRSLDSSQKSFQQCVAHNLTSLNRGDTVKKKDAKKYSTTSEEVCPVYLLRNTKTKVDVRHAKEVKKFSAITSYALTKSCDQNQCPAMQERLTQHKNEHHRQHARTWSTKRLRDQGVNVSPTFSRHASKSSMRLHSVRSVQTDITLHDVVVHKDTVPNSLSYTKDVPLKRCETRDIVPNCNFYKEHLQNEIMGWLLNVPIFYSVDFTTKYLKENIVNVLVDKIDRMTPQANRKRYEEKVKIEIADCLNILPMWLPNTVSEQTLFKNALRNKLYDRIKLLNAKFLGVHDEKDNAEAKTNDIKAEGDLNHHNEEIITKEIHMWLSGIKFTRAVGRKRIVDMIMKKITPLLNVSVHTRSYKLILKGEIVDVLDELPINLLNSKNKSVILSKYAEDLANKLLSIQLKLDPPVKHENSRSRDFIAQCASHIIGIPLYNSRIRLTIQDKINKALGNIKIHSKKDVKEEICDTILNSLETLRTGVENNINNEIYEILRRSNTITEDKAKSIAKKIKLYVKIALKHEKDAMKSSYQCLKPELSGVLSIYRSNSNNPVTSTPKKPAKKDIPKLNPEEKSYMNKVAALIRAWMETLPNNFNDDKKYKDTIINDLAGDIMDEVKREQLLPESNTEKEKHVNYIVYRWLVRFDVFEDLNDAKPLVENLLAKLKQIPEPTLTAPQHGTRQAMHYIKRSEMDFDNNEEFIPKGIDVLEDQISVWMNEQPSEIYSSDSKKKRSKIVKDLALTLQDRLRNKSPEDEIEKDISRWLKHVVKAKEKEHIGLLTQNLKRKIINVPQDETLEARHEKRKRQRIEYRQDVPTTANAEPDNVKAYQEDPDKTMTEFILKYMEHYYDIDDPMARGAFAQLLKVELRKLSPPTRKEVYDHFAQETTHDNFRPERLNEVLEYVKIISDWLRNIPVESYYNNTGIVSRIDFVNDLARNIQELEDQRKEHPNDMDYDSYISSVISRSIHTYNVPVLQEHKDNVPLMVNQLLSRIIANRSIISPNDSTISDIKEQNLSEFIDEYIRINGREIVDDELKLEAWTALLQKEIKKMIHEDVHPSKLCKGEIYEKFSRVPIPSDESVRRFSLEISYIKEISNWLNNFPLLPIDNIPEAQEERIQMISDLAQKIAEREGKKNTDPNDNTADKELVQYITDWIAKLPLDPRKSIVVPILIQQLMNKIDKDLKPNVIPDKSKTEKKATHKSKINLIDAEATRDPGAHMVEFIDKWCNKLPIQGDDPAAVKNIKNDIARNLYKKIGELNIDPRVFNDDILFKDLLEDEIDTQFENLPQDARLQDRREELKAELLDTIVDLKKVIDHKSTGDNYKHMLESAIEAAIPEPIQSRQTIEPGFEIYKNHLANVFILENFDHSNEDVKSKYENKIREEIDRYFESARNKNALPVTKEQMFNELYSELFKVPMPNKESVIDEVEEVKTRCEVEAWFEELPLRDAEDICEYLEWDQIVSTLAKRIHEIEKTESNPDEDIKKEIIKWLEKLPLLPGQENNINQFTDKLQKVLKLSAEARKYVPESKKASKGKAIVKHEVKQSPNTSQVAGPYRKGDIWVSPPSTPELDTYKPVSATQTAVKKSGDLIEEIVEDWCNQLPLAGKQTENKIVRDNLSTQLIVKICELNMDADIFNDDIIYDQVLDEEIDKHLSDLVGCCEFEKSKSARKYQLKEMIKSIKPLIKEEKKRHEYKEELNNTVECILNDHSKKKDKEFNKLKENIVDNFVEYNYNKYDDEAKQAHKSKVHEAVVKYVTKVQNTAENVDALVRRNQLLCELSKIPAPDDTVLKEEVIEIKMKNALEQFFERNSLDDKTEKTAQMIKTLSKRLNDIEKSGHNDANDKKMATEIDKCLKKLNKNVSTKVIEDFVKNLKNNEAERKSSPCNKSILNETDVYRRRSDEFSNRYRSGSPSVNMPQLIFPCPGCQQPIITPQTGLHQSAQYLQVPTQHDLSHCQSAQQWVSRELEAPLFNQLITYHDPYVMRGIRPESDSNWNPPSINQNQLQLDNYEDFKSGQFQNASILPQGYAYSEYNTNLRPSPRLERDQIVRSADQDLENKLYPNPHIAVSEGATKQYPQSQNYSQIPESLPHLDNEYQNYDSNNRVSFAPPRTPDLTQGYLHYDSFKPTLSSTAIPPENIRPEQHSNFSQRYDRRPQSAGTVSSYSQSLNRRSAYEIPMYGSPVTPRAVQGEALPYEPSIPEEMTPESLFQAPVFAPRPLYSRLTIPGGLHAESYHPTRAVSEISSRQGSELNRGWREPRDIDSSETVRYRCRCDKKLKKYDSGPYCMIPMDEYCDECGGFCPMWCKMPLPSCFYLH